MNNKVLNKIGIIISFLLLTASVDAQRYLDFVENKGQWDAAIKFKAEMPAGAFVLQADGYKVLQYDVKELQASKEKLHPMKNSSGDTKSEKLKVTKPIPEGNVGEDDSDDFILHSHVYEVKFLNSNPRPEVIPEKPLPTVNNYFIGEDSSKWASNCKTFQAVTYKNIYPNIDIRYYTSNGTLKYDLIVHPGGDISKVVFYYDGIDNDDLKIKNGLLQIKTSVGTISEDVPLSYQISETSRAEIDCSYELKGKYLRFKVGKDYNKRNTLIIDPRITFITYSGSIADNWGFSATYDNLGNFYAGGIVFGTSSPFNIGPYQKKWNGGKFLGIGIDMGILKFSPDGQSLIYATYIGGAGDEQPHSLIATPQGNLVIAGRTNSDDYPKKGIGKLGIGGNYDIVITQLNASGSALIGSCVIGGSNNDGVNIRPNYIGTQQSESTRRNYGDDARSEVIIDNTGNIILASVTQSEDFPTVKPFQSSHASPKKNNNQDGVLIKLDPTLSNILFSSFLGGGGDDAAFVLAINPTNGNIYVAGATESSDMPQTNNAAPKFKTFNGNIDGFISIIKNDGSAIINTSYIGTNGIDVLFGIQFDKKGFPYITGTTTGVFPVINSPYNTKDPTQVNGKQFIAKLQPDLSDFIFFTNFGSKNGTQIPTLSITAFLVDRCENVYISGWGGFSIGGYRMGSIANMPLTLPPNGAYKDYYIDKGEFYFFALKKNAEELLYATYFGQDVGYPDHVDGGTSRFDPNGTIYQSICSCGQGRGEGISTKPIRGTGGSWSENSGNDNCNLLAVKLAFDLAGVGAGPRSSINGKVRDTAGCFPLTVDFIDTLDLAKQFIWNFNDGSKEDTTTINKITHEFKTPGLFKVRLIAVDVTSCNERDTAYLNIRVGDNIAKLNFNPEKQPPCASLTYKFYNLSTNSLNKPFAPNASFIWDFGDGQTKITGSETVTHTYSGNGTYIVKLKIIDESFCNNNEELRRSIFITQIATASFTTPLQGCAPYSAVFNNTSTSGLTYLWDFGDGPGSTSNEAYPNPYLYKKAGKYTINLTVFDPNCSAPVLSAPLTITVYDIPKADFSYSPTIPERNKPITFVNQSIGGTKFEWQFGDGDKQITTLVSQTVKHQYKVTGTYTASLITFNNAGCSDTTFQTFSVEVDPVFGVANAFSPNGDNVNDIIYVNGFGIVKMAWRIYNRWGELVFFSSDPSIGWNGMYKGKIQQQDVYHYTLELEFGTKERVTKKGDITLLR